ncbi:MAG: adenylate kinase [Limisphaerales bacterium]|nr:MAG: adenylate kinase [Limisphaerales bacterium]KAG0507667.1 MAG: adenylate kinase [Limisphaerales bacterium]TXT51786.1 MAG: adenylate kinase [Limisphaerales bacterium]
MNLSLIGPSGAGKGTHAGALVKELWLEHVATGDLFRQNLEDQTTLGLLARRYMDRGELVPDEIVDAMVEDWVRKSDPAGDILFDGFPRTEYQARFLDDLLTGLGSRLDAVVLLNLSEAEMLRRLDGRLICRTCKTPYHATMRPPARAGVCDGCGGELQRRPDDEADRALARLRMFQRTAGPVLEYYQPSGRLRVIEADGPVDKVQWAILNALESLRTRGAAFKPTGATVTLPAWHRQALLLPSYERHACLGLVLLGGPGSGKGTQAEQLTKELQLPHIATGDLFRENLRQATELGRQAKGYMDRGELVPDEITEAMVRERLARSDTAGGFILDGFPRTLPQAMALNEMLTDLQRRVAGVLCIAVSDEAIVDRLSGRLICRQCQTPYHTSYKRPQRAGVCDRCNGELYQRDDDNPATVRARLKTFHAQTEPLIQFYRDAGMLTQVDGQGEVANVTAHTLAAARALQNAIT